MTVPTTRAELFAAAQAAADRTEAEHAEAARKVALERILGARVGCEAYDRAPAGSRYRGGLCMRPPVYLALVTSRGSRRVRTMFYVCQDHRPGYDRFAAQTAGTRYGQAWTWLLIGGR